LAQARPSIRRHGLEALCIYSKYIGCYNLFKDIRTKYQLHWGAANEDNLRYFTNYVQGHSNLEVMLSWLKDTLKKLPQLVGNILLHNVLGILENFRYPEFINRKTKRSYITIYDDSILQVALNCKLFKSWETFRKKLNRCGVDSVNTKYCRAIFATWLRKCGIEQEIISLYQGRVPSTVFQASYLKTNIREDRERILKAVHQLKKELEK
jgi:hypothetical protein